MKIHSKGAWEIASQYSYMLASDTRTLAAQIDALIEEEIRAVKADMVATVTSLYGCNLPDKKGGEKMFGRQRQHVYAHSDYRPLGEKMFGRQRQHVYAHSDYRPLGEKMFGRQRQYVYAHSDYRPLGEKKPIGTAVTEAGAKRVYWKWESENFQAGQRWYPVSMLLGEKGWLLGTAKKR